MPPPKKTPAINDPLEGVKLEKQGKAEPEPEPVAVAAPPPVAAAPAAPPPVSKAKRYRVKARTHVSHYGQMLVLHPDDILSADSYGDAGLQRLLESVPTEELP